MDDDDDYEASLELVEDELEPLIEATILRGAALIREKARIAPKSAGVYRMISEKNEVLYVGKAKHIQRRILSYTRPKGLVTRIARMVSQTVEMEFISTRTETEALLLEANLIKQLKPRYNVLLRDDKSFPYIFISNDSRAPELAKLRGAKSRKGEYFGPFASTWSVNRAMHALQRAFLLRSCSASEFENRTRPCLLYQIKRCAAPCTHEISDADYAVLVKEAKLFLSGKSHVIKTTLASQMDEAAQALDYERAAIYRDRLAALSGVQSTQNINPRNVDEADIFAAYQDNGATCIQVFFFRNGQNWGNRAYFPRADKTLEAGEVLAPFIAQFYADKPVPSLVLTSHELFEAKLLEEAYSLKMERKVTFTTPLRGEKKEIVEQAVHNAKEALARKLTETATQKMLLQALQAAFALPKIPFRIEIYDNSHISGTNAVGAFVVAGLEGFNKKEYRKFNIKSSEGQTGDDFAMMREVFTRRFREKGEDEEASRQPDLIIIDGGQGQLSAAQGVLDELNITIPLLSIAKGRDREAGRETFHMSGRPPKQLDRRDQVLFFIERMRDEAHRFAIGSHRTKRAKTMREGGLNEIAGLGPTRRRALMRHFGTVKAIERASLEDLRTTSGVNEATAKAVYAFFHP